MVMRAFWNIHGPGCNEHLLVHKLRESEDYIPQLSRIAELDGKISEAHAAMLAGMEAVHGAGDALHAVEERKRSRQENRERILHFAYHSVLLVAKVAVPMAGLFQKKP